jgi:hypothetical protein
VLSRSSPSPRSRPVSAWLFVSCQSQAPAAPAVDAAMVLLDDVAEEFTLSKPRKAPEFLCSLHL